VGPARWEMLAAVDIEFAFPAFPAFSLESQLQYACALMRALVKSFDLICGFRHVAFCPLLLLHLVYSFNFLFVLTYYEYNLLSCPTSPGPELIQIVRQKCPSSPQTVHKFVKAFRPCFSGGVCAGRDDAIVKLNF